MWWTLAKAEQIKALLPTVDHAHTPEAQEQIDKRGDRRHLTAKAKFLMATLKRVGRVAAARIGVSLDVVTQHIATVPFEMSYILRAHLNDEDCMVKDPYATYEEDESCECCDVCNDGTHATHFTDEMCGPAQPHRQQPE